MRDWRALRNKQKSTWAAIFFIHVVNWNQSGLYRRPLESWFINTVPISIWVIYQVYLNRWKASNRWFWHFTPERKMHTSVKFKGHQLLMSGFSPQMTCDISLHHIHENTLEDTCQTLLSTSFQNTWDVWLFEGHHYAMPCCWMHLLSRAAELWLTQSKNVCTLPIQHIQRHHASGNN